MPKQNKGKLIDVENLEQAKKILSDIVALTEKQYQYTTNAAKQQKIVEEQMKDKDDVIALFKQLEDVTGNSFKQYKISINTVMKDLKSIAEDIGSDINEQLEQRIKTQADINIAVEKEVAKRKEIERVESSRQKLIRDSNSLELEANNILQKQYKEIDKIAAKEYDSMSNLQKMKYGSKENYVTTRGAELKKTYNTEYQNLINETTNEAFNTGGSVSKKDLKNLSDQAFGKVNESTEEFNDSLGKFNLASEAWDVLAGSIKKQFDEIFSIFKQGLDDQRNLYNETFENISVRTNTTRSDYLSQQASTDNTLSSMGLYDNIKVSEVQQMWSDLANTGMNEQDMFATAIDNVLTSKIVPYLETTTTQFNILNNRLDGKFVKDIRGINQANLDIAGSNYVTSDLLNDIEELVQPMSDAAIEDLAKNSTEVTSMANKLVSEYGWDESDAKEYAETAFKYQNYGAQTLNSGSISDKMKYINILNSGLDVNDLSNANNIAGIAINTDTSLMNMTGANYNSTMGSFLANTAATAFGIDTSTARNITTKQVNGSQLASETDLTDEEYNKYVESATSDYTNGENQTAEQMQKTTISNIATNVASIEEQIGIFSTFGESLLIGLGGLFTGEVLNAITGGKIGSWLGGIFGSSAKAGEATSALTGSGGILSSAGGLALGTIAGVTAITAISTAVENGTKEKARTEQEQIFEEEGSDLAGNTAAAAGTSTNSLKDTNFWTDIAIIPQTLSEFGNNVANTFSSDIGASNKRRYNNLLTALQSSGKTEEEKEEYTLAFMLLLGGEHRLRDIDTNEDDLKAWVESDNGPSMINAVGKIGKAPLWVYQPHNSQGKVESVNDSWFKDTALNWNYHRQGLDEVPYDDYPALLHEGEAVLTSGTANEMRDLVDEYRDTNNQNANFDVIIEGQTTALLSKMDDIISAISSSSSNTSTVTNLLNSNNKNSSLKNAMVNLVSSRQFG